jgi:hypothetical protein
MHRRLTGIVIGTALVVAGTGCGDESSTGDSAATTTTVEGAAPTTTPTTVAPTTPTTVAPTTPTSGDPDAPTSSTDTPEPQLPTRYVEIDDGAFDSIGDMADASDVVVVATVTEEEAISSDRTDVNPSAAESLGLRLRVDEVLKGEPGDEIRLAWFAFELGEDGEPIATNLLNGIPVPRIGDQLVLFLRPVTPESQALLDYATHAPVMLDGVGFVEDGVVTITDEVVPEIAVLTGATLDEIRASV